MQGLTQIGPGVWVADAGANQSVENRNAPGGLGAFPVGPMGFRRRFKAGPDGSQSVVDVGDFVDFNGELVVPVGLTSISVLPEPAGLRNCLGFRNSSAAAANIWIAFGNPATSNSWLKIAQDVIVLLDTRPPQDEVFAISSTAAGQLTIVQSIMPGSFT